MTWNNMVSNMKHDDLISYDMKRNEDYILLENLLGYHMLYLDTLRYAIVTYNCQKKNIISDLIVYDMLGYHMCCIICHNITYYAVT